jgi:hypothetical protein
VKEVRKSKATEKIESKRFIKKIDDYREYMLSRKFMPIKKSTFDS